MQLRNVHFGRGAALGGLSLMLLTGVCAAAPAAVVSGVVRDSKGVAQMGALVQVLAAGSASVATAFTDIYGRYRIVNLVPGRYQVRASAALFVPAIRANLLLATGTRATVNLTITMLSDTSAWIPAERRKPDEPGDDWSWTLRSAANRPVLRMLGDGPMATVSSSASEARQAESTVARASMMSGDGGFGGGGSHHVLSIDRVLDDGSDAVLRTDIAAARTPYGRGPSVEFDAGYERRTAFAGASRLVVSYESHPEMMSSGGAAGLQAIRMASAEKMNLGDMAEVEAGGAVYALHTAGYAISSQPFLRVAVHPGDVWTVGYRMATSRDLQGFDGLNSVEAGLPVAALSGGKLRTESGIHQEISVARKLGEGTVQAAFYRDAIRHSLVSGNGVLPAGCRSAGLVADTVTDNFEFLGAGYTARGASVMLSEPLNSSVWAVVEYQNGAALSARGAVAVSLPEVVDGLHAEDARAASAALEGRVVRSGTRLRAAYRWQPVRLVTPVAGYEAFSGQAYLSFYVRQSVRWGDKLPPGLEATVDVTNLLAQGYQPFLSADGQTLFLAQTPRTLQGGLSFTF